MDEETIDILIKVKAQQVSAKSNSFRAIDAVSSPLAALFCRLYRRAPCIARDH